jgi:hypothetical protein
MPLLALGVVKVAPASLSRLTDELGERLEVARYRAMSTLRPYAYITNPSTCKRKFGRLPLLPATASIISTVRPVTRAISSSDQPFRRAAVIAVSKECLGCTY